MYGFNGLGRVPLRSAHLKENTGPASRGAILISAGFCGDAAGVEGRTNPKLFGTGLAQ
jgi:hypothetical protein